MTWTHGFSPNLVQMQRWWARENVHVLDPLGSVGSVLCLSFLLLFPSSPPSTPLSCSTGLLHSHSFFLTENFFLSHFILTSLFELPTPFISPPLLPHYPLPPPVSYLAPFSPPPLLPSWIFSLLSPLSQCVAERIQHSSWKFFLFKIYYLLILYNSSHLLYLCSNYCLKICSYDISLNYLITSIPQP